MASTSPNHTTTCPHCGAGYTPSAIITTCAKCGAPLSEPPPELHLPPAPDLSGAAKSVPDLERATPDRAPAQPAKPAPEEKLPLLAPPPRPVPVSLRLQAMFGAATSQIGWFFLGFGLIFVWAFGGLMDFGPLLFYKGPWQTTDGVLTESRPTSWRVNGVPVYAHTYRFATPDGRDWVHTSRCPGQQLATGTPVTVEYREGDPSVSRIRGMSGGSMPLWILPIICVFPLVGLGFVIPALRSGWRANRLLQMGALATGTLASKRPTGTRINNQELYELTFDFLAGDGHVYQVKARTTDPERLQDQRQEPLLHDPFNPSYAVMFDSLPGAPEIDAFGNLRGAGWGRALALMVVPLLTVVGHGTYLWLRFVR